MNFWSSKRRKDPKLRPCYNRKLLCRTPLEPYSTPSYAQWKMKSLLPRLQSLSTRWASLPKPRKQKTSAAS